MRSSPRVSLWLAGLLSVALPLSAAQVTKVVVQTPVTGSVGAAGGAGYSASQSVSRHTEFQPLLRSSVFSHAMPVSLAPSLPVSAMPHAAPAELGAALPAALPADGPTLLAPSEGKDATALKVPRGAKGVTLHTAKTPADVSRLIPAGANSDGLIAGLRQAVRKHGPIKIRVYQDAVGGSFVALDLQGSEKWLEHIPELEKHEKVLIRKILKRTSDVQVVVREEGKTPDLVVDGTVTELKTDFGKHSVDRLVGKANRQVVDFSRRHMLEGGDLAIDFASDPSIDVKQVMGELNRWAGKTKDVILGRILSFAGDDMKTFALGEDGQYSLGKTPFPSRSVPSRASEVHAAQLLAKKGLLNEAQEKLRRLGAYDEGGDQYRPAVQARQSLEAKRALLKIKKHLRRDPKRAQAVWNRYQRSHSKAEAARIASEVERLFRKAEKRIPLAEKTDEIVREVEEPVKILRQHGIEATVTVYGSARILPRPAAVLRLKKALNRHGQSPSTEKGRQAVAQARRDLENSRWYEEARRFGSLVARGSNRKIAVMTGGGPGIMEAANRGAFEAGGPSVGYNIRIKEEQKLNPYITSGLEFEFKNFTTRKMNLRHGGLALVYFPGGFGTMDEFFENLTLMQNGSIPRVPIVLVGEKAYWQSIIGFQKFADMGLISEADLDLLRYAENAEEAWEHIRPSFEDSGSPMLTVRSF